MAKTGRLRFNISMSLDGYVAGPDPTPDNPLGEGGESIHEWVVKLRSWREMHGMEGGETGPNEDVVRETMENIGATIMGRNMFGPVSGGPWGDDPWKGWWGEEPPFHHPVFVLTHHARKPLEMQGGTTFNFVANGIEPALNQALEAAGGRDVMLGGGANAAQQYLGAGLVDEMEIHLVPVLLHGGTPLFDNLSGSGLKLELIRTLAGPGVTHLKYRPVK